MDQDDLFADNLPPPLANDVKPMREGDNQDNDQDKVALDRYAERAYLEYAMSVVKGRALPDVSDGQKPVQRRILYAMRDMGLVSGVKPVKSARVVGEILGKYHPHGDSSAYDALVRMAQDFTLRYPLIDGQGNFGSRDGDGAAAMRYTEARLTPIAELLLSELNLGTVEFSPTYDGAFQEPKVLPSRLPFVLLNGASGIAVGLATEIPPHNLLEVANACVELLKNPELTTCDLVQLIPGPDFPGGGQIISSASDIFAAYESGRGSVRVRACWEVEKLARGQWRIIVTQLPPGCSAQKVLAEIEEATNPKVRLGKKVLTQDQQNLKSLMLSVLDRVRDESDNVHPVRLVFEPKTSRQDPEVFIHLLLAHTSLESNISLNLVVIGLDGRPRQQGLRAILKEWLTFRHATVLKRIEHRLLHVEKRIHILEGRLIAFIHIEEVIRIIRESEEPKHELMEAFALSDTQAEDILDIRLRQLARLEGIKLEQGLAELREEQSALHLLLTQPEARRELIIDEIRKDALSFGDARRTIICEAARAAVTRTIVDEPSTVILSRKGWIRARTGHNLDTSSLTFKDGDSLHVVLETRTIYPILLLDSQGRSYSIDFTDLPSGRGEGVPVTSLIDMQKGVEIAYLLAGVPTERYMLAHSGGYGFIACIRDMVSRTRSGKAFITLEPGERLLPPVKIPSSEGQTQYIAVTSSTRLLVFELAELRELSKGRGLKLMQLEKNDALTSAGLVSYRYFLLIGLSPRGKQITEKVVLAEYYAKRAKRGKVLPKKCLVTHIDDGPLS